MSHSLTVPSLLSTPVSGPARRALQAPTTCRWPGHILGAKTSPARARPTCGLESQWLDVGGRLSQRARGKFAPTSRCQTPPVFMSNNETTSDVDPTAQTADASE